MNRIVWHFGHGYIIKRFSGRHEIPLVYKTIAIHLILIPKNPQNIRKRISKEGKYGTLSGNPLAKSIGRVGYPE
jgi:hypothetical protein